MADNALLGPPSDLDAIRRRVGAQYPALAPHVNAMALQWGTPETGANRGHLEFYPPWESDNPNKGQSTLEFYDPQMQGNALQSAIAGDSLHLVGAVDPRTNRAVDPQWLAMKRALVGSLTPQQLAVDQRAYEMDKQRGETRPFDDWMQDSRADAYIRGYITPDAADEWRKKGTYTPDQSNLLTAMKQYLQKPPVSPDNMPPDNALAQIASRGIWEDR